MYKSKGIEMEGSYKSGDALHVGKLPMSISTAVGITDSLPSSSRTKVESASTSSGEPSGPSNGVSVRIGRLMQRSCEFDSPVEFEIEASKDHWSQLSTLTSAEQEGKSVESNWNVSLELRSKWGFFFEQYHPLDLVVGEKIAEGVQAEIVNATWQTDLEVSGGYKYETILKVFKDEYSLRDLEKQWPQGMLPGLHNLRPGLHDPRPWTPITPRCSIIFAATFLMNERFTGRFAFHMIKYWGDLRTLIDRRMQLNGNHDPPFRHSEVGNILLQIALGVHELHKHDIIHRDLKASNMLYRSKSGKKFDPALYYFDDGLLFDVADYESSVGIVGTGFWRAPEILQAVQMHDIKPHLFTKKSDAYSFGMICYEVLTGSIPFEDLVNCYNVVIEGQRPKLPKYIHRSLKTLLKRCWHVNPLQRPSFEEIVSLLVKIYPNVGA